jgi:hypothetical protein
MTDKPVPAHEDSIRLALRLAWKDHHHVRDQAWKALFAQIALTALLVAADFFLRSCAATFLIGFVAVLAAISGMLFLLHHRRIEARKFSHIYNCEEALGLHRDDLLPVASCAPPAALSWKDLFRPSLNNSVIFLLRLELLLGVFAVVYVLGRLALC